MSAFSINVYHISDSLLNSGTISKLGTWFVPIHQIANSIFIDVTLSTVTLLVFSTDELSIAEDCAMQEKELKIKNNKLNKK